MHCNTKLVLAESWQVRMGAGVQGMVRMVRMGAFFYTMFVVISSATALPTDTGAFGPVQT